MHLDAFQQVFINKTDKPVYAAIYFPEEIRYINLAPNQYTSFITYTKPQSIKFINQSMTRLSKLYKSTGTVWEIHTRYNGDLCVLNADKQSYEKSTKTIYSAANAARL